MLTNVYFFLTSTSSMIFTVQFVCMTEWPGPSRATVGPGKTLSRALSPPHFVCLEIEKALRGRKRGERCPLTIWLGVRGSIVSSPSGVWGPKMDFMHILSQKEAIWNIIFSIFERRRGPPNVAGNGKTSPFPPLSMGLRMTVEDYAADTDTYIKWMARSVPGARHIGRQVWRRRRTNSRRLWSLLSACTTVSRLHQCRQLIGWPRHRLAADHLG